MKPILFNYFYSWNQFESTKEYLRNRKLTKTLPQVEPKRRKKTRRDVEIAKNYFKKQKVDTSWIIELFSQNAKN